MASGAIKRVTVNLPRGLLAEATALTGVGTTETLIQGLELVARRRAYAKAMSLKGKLDIRLDLDVARERTRR